MTTQVLGDEPSPEERGEATVSHFETIGRYRVLQELGQGGMGIVHLALDERGRAVAVKVLRPHVAHDEDARSRLAREVDTLARVRSDRIAPAAVRSLAVSWVSFGRGAYISPGPPPTAAKSCASRIPPSRSIRSESSLFVVSYRGWTSSIRARRSATEMRGMWVAEGCFLGSSV